MIKTIKVSALNYIIKNLPPASILPISTIIIFKSLCHTGSSITNNRKIELLFYPGLQRLNFPTYKCPLVDSIMLSPA